ncbi:MAG: CARDB domain-containing protein, partial [Chloroflexota bacterium]
NAARAAGRYAVTGQYDPSCLNETPPCEDPRVESIKAVAREALGGLALDDDAAFEDPQYYLIEVFGTDEHGQQRANYAGAPGMPIIVRVTYRVGMVTPLVQPIANTVRVTGQVVFNNEQFAQVSNSRDQVQQITPLPPVEPTPTPFPPDLQLTKSDSVSPNPAIVDEPFFYTLSIANIGETDLEGITVVDELPEGISYISGPAGCDVEDRVVTCDGIDLEAMDSLSLNLQVEADEDLAGETVENTATVSHPLDQTPDNNSDTHETAIIGPPTEADVTVDKSPSSTLVAVGDDLVYTIGVTNRGLADAENVTIVDTLPAGVNFDSADASQGSCESPDGNEITCNLGDISYPDPGFASVTIRVQPNQEGMIVNTVEVFADNEPDDDDDSLNQSSATVEVQNVSDLSVTKTASADPVMDEEMTYTVNVVNNGPATATEVQMQDSLPPSVTVQSIDASQGNCSESGNVVDCDLGNLAAHANATVTIVVIPNEVGSITNWAAVSGEQADPFPANDEFELNTTIQPRADLGISKTASADPAEVGNELVYTLNVTNHGPGPAEDVTIEDDLPGSVVFLSASASQGTCGDSTNLVICDLGDMVEGATAEVTIRVVPNEPGEITNTASVDSNTFDPEPDNDISDPVVTEVNASDAYIVLDQYCGKPGDEITVSGYDWSTHQSNHYDIYLELWDEESGTFESLGQPFDNNENWEQLVTIPDEPNGQYLIRAHRSRQQGQGMSTQAEDAVSFEIPCPAPNLVVDELEVITPTEVLVGDTVTFRAVISNVGNKDAINQFFNGLYFDPPQPDPDDQQIDQNYRVGIVALNTLAIDASKVVTFTIENAFETAGSHEVYAVADSDSDPDGEGRIPGEHSESDNISAPLEVDVSPASPPTSTPTPTATGTGTPAPTATATATPTVTPTPEPTSAPGTLVVTVFNQSGEPQASAEINVYDEDSGEVVATGYSDIDGNYFFDSIPADTYTVTACITIENDDYFRSASGVIVNTGEVTQLVLFLQPSPAGCV